MKQDIEIAREAELRPIYEIAAKMGIPEEALEPYGKNKAKISLDFCFKCRKQHKPGKLILVTATSPTPAGEGKTTTSIGLTEALNRLNKQAAVCIREPSLGPVFGIKGGAAGGGYSQVVPMEDINLHFTGDLHAITSAHNSLAALMNNAIYRRKIDLDPKRILWNRVMDVNDRALRNIIVGLGGHTDGVSHQSSFDITAASELMAILCLSNNIAELKEKIGNILLGFNYAGDPVYCRDLGVEGAITVLLFTPSLTVMVTTIRALKMHGGQLLDRITLKNIETLRKGLPNLGRHLENTKKFGVDCVVALNKIMSDTDEEIQIVVDYCKELGFDVAISEVWEKGGEGGEALAKLVLNHLDAGKTDYHKLYDWNLPVEDKIRIIAKEIYRADDIELLGEAIEDIKFINKLKLDNLPICIAKTQKSFSDNPNLLGAPTGFTMKVRRVIIASGAGFLIPITGKMLRMPGLPLIPAAESIDIDYDGDVVGLF